MKKAYLTHLFWIATHPRDARAIRRRLEGLR